MKQYNVEFVKAYLLSKDILFLDEKYKNNKQSLKVKCLKCNYNSYADAWSPSFNHILVRGDGCPSCSGKKNRDSMLYQH